MGLLEHRHCLLVLSRIRQGLAGKERELPVFRRQLVNLYPFLNRVRLLLSLVDETEMEMRFRKIRLKPDCNAKLLFGVRPILRQRIERAEIVTKLRIAGLLGGCLFHAANCRGCLTG